MNTVSQYSSSNGVSHSPSTIASSLVLADDIATTFETFTKQQAQLLFDNRVQQRSIRIDKVNEYRDLMNNGKWINRCRTQTPILFDKDGNLVGGQHRFFGYIKSDLITIEFPVARNVSANELPYQDANITRTTRDRVAMFYRMPTFKNITNATLIATIKIVMDYKNHNTGSKLNTSDPESIAKVGKDLQSVVIGLDQILNKKSIIVRHAAMVAAFLIAHDLMDSSKWNYCVTKTSNFEGLYHQDAMYSFRDFADHLPKGFSNEARWEVFIKTLFCLRAHERDEKVSRVIAQKSSLDAQTWK